MTQIDQAADIREGEELDLSAVDRFMKGAIPDLTGEPVIRQYPGGASNLTYQVDYGDRSFVLRRPSTLMCPISSRFAMITTCWGAISM
jgi:aminoglycoside phosphotransferase (APT) family kinase protein